VPLELLALRALVNAAGIPLIDWRLQDWSAPLEGAIGPSPAAASARHWSCKTGGHVMVANRGIRRIVVGLDGSDHALAALDWAMALARPLGAEIVAVYAIPPPTYIGYGYEMVPPPLDPEWRSEVTREFEREWCHALRESGLPHRMIVEDGRPASVIAEVADRVDADLVVVGRRGRGGIAELLLGSVSHELSHHCGRPVLLISHARAAAPGRPSEKQAIVAT
jgi:nucleotide-binding universal stress UspA family protein